MTAHFGFLSAVAMFAAYFAEALALLGLFLLIYTWVTPHRELPLIRAGNAAAAISLGGATLGFVLPLASVIANSASLIEVACWGVVALLAQLAVFRAIRLAIPTLSDDITAGNGAVAGLVAALAVGVGTLNAVCMIP